MRQDRTRRASHRRPITGGALGMTTEALEPRRLFSVNVLVHHNDPGNDGQNLAETVLTPANVNPADFGKQFSTKLDGAVYAQPLYVQNVNITRGGSAGVHSVAYVATMHDSLYAIDANTGAVLWQDSFLNTADPATTTAAAPVTTAGVTTVPAADLNSSNINPELGILATPAIDATRNEMFLNAATQEVTGGQTHFVQRLWGISLSDGSAVSAPAVIGDTVVASSATYSSYSGYTYVAGPIVDGTGNNSNPTTYPNTDGWLAAPGNAATPVIAFNALLQMQRTAVTLLNGNVYLGFASHGDNGPYYGWLLGYSETNLSLTAAFVTTPTYEGIVGDRADFTAQGGIWSSGSAIATDGTYLYVTVGNGAFNPAASNFDAAGFPIDHDYGDSVLKLAIDAASSATNQNGNGFGLKVVDYFTPSNENTLNLKDLDFGSGGVLLLPSTVTDSAGNPLLVVGGKESRMYVLDRNNLGKFNDTYPLTSNPDPRAYDHVVNEYAGDGTDGTSQGIYSTPTYFDGTVYLGQAHADALAFSASTLASGAAPAALQSTTAFGFPEPTFSLSADGSSNALLWGIDFANSDLFAYSASNLTTPLYTSSTNAADRFTSASKFSVATIANGMAYVATGSGQFLGYGLNATELASDSANFSAPANLAVTLGGSNDLHLTWTDHATLATELRIDRSTDGATWTVVANLSNGSSAYDDTTAAPGVAYQYRVVAISGANATAASNITLYTPPLTGSVIGTTGSYQNDGNTAAKAFDGNLSTFFDAPTAGTAAVPNWVGLDLGTTYAITSLAYISRSGWASRMNGGIFQASNDPTFASGVVNLYTIGSSANPSSTALTTQSVSTNGAGYRYVRYLAPAGSYGNVAEVQFFGTPAAATPPGNTPLSGTAIGTAGSYQNDGNTIAKAFDGNLATFFDAPTAGTAASPDWVGLDLGATYAITGLAYASRSGWSSRMNGGVFQASNDPTFATGTVTLYTIASNANPSSTRLTTQAVSTNGDGYRYVRYLAPAGAYGNIAELQFFGTPAAAGPSAGGTISGVVTASAQPVAGETIYLDANNNSTLDAGELSTTTNASGGYSFTDVPPGAYIVRQVLPAGYTQTSPTNNFGIHLTVTASSDFSDQNFTDTAPATLPANLLTGTVIGTAGSYQNSGNTIIKAFDNNLATFFDAPTAGTAAAPNWVGLDLGGPASVSQIRFAPRSGWAQRMVGGVFQASDTADFSSGVVNLYTITAAPPVGVLTTVNVTATGSYRYVRYLAPAGGYGNIAELQFLGTLDPLTPALQSVLALAQTQVEKTVAAVGSTSNYPQYTNPDGSWSWTNAGAWTAGFLPALLWQLYDATGNALYATQATQLTLPVNAASENETSDNGFRMYLTDLPLLQQDPGDPAIINALLTAAAAKSTTYNAAVGGFEAWRGSTSGNPDANFDVLMDMITDLPLQLWAAQQSGNQTLATQAIQGAVTEENYLVRPDGSSAQFAYFDSTTGQFVDNETYEGYSASSTWSRGQAWGIYGFTMMASLTGRSDFLATAEKMANWYLAHLPADSVPYWDFDDPAIPNAPRDTSAAAVAAAGLLKLSALIAPTDPTTAATYGAAAAATLGSLASPAYLVNPNSAAEGDGVLLHGALNVPATPSISDNSIVFGDYYFIQAINQYLAGT